MKIENLEFLLQQAYRYEIAAPGEIFLLLQPEAVLRKICRECRLGPRRGICVRGRPVRRPVPRQRRMSGTRAAGADGGGSDPDPDPDPHLGLQVAGRLWAGRVRPWA